MFLKFGLLEYEDSSEDARTRWPLHLWAFASGIHRHGGIWHLSLNLRIFLLWTQPGLRDYSLTLAKPTQSPFHWHLDQAHELQGLHQAHKKVSWCCGTCSRSSWWKSRLPSLMLNLSLCPYPQASLDSAKYLIKSKWKSKGITSNAAKW